MTLEEALEEIERLQEAVIGEMAKLGRAYRLAEHWKNTGNGHWRELLNALEGK